MELSPKAYHRIVRPKWFTELFMKNIMLDEFDLNDKAVLDFGCGIGSCSHMFKPENYIGVDCDYKRIQYAKKLHPDYKFYTTNQNKLPMYLKPVDYILIFSVLHHISSNHINDYLKEFRKILKTGGKILVIEPCLFKKSYICNRFMKFFDDGEYIRNTEQYLDLFHRNSFNTKVIRRYNQLLFYNKIFFEAVPI